MSKHKGADQQRGKPSQQREQAAGQNRDPRKPNEGGAQDRGAQQDRQNTQQADKYQAGESNR